MESNQQILQQWVSSKRVLGTVVHSEAHLREILAAKSLPTQFQSFHIRLLPYGSMATQDFSTNRLNILLDKKKRIQSVSIG